MLVQIGWHFRHSPRVRPLIATCHDHLSQPVTDIAGAAQLRSHGKFKRLVARAR